MVYISIESRKGGVGKTTVALSLAETLLENGYQVLMLDLDIVGTKMDPTFLEENCASIHEVSIQNKPVNLLRLFKEVYMTGKNIPAFSDDKEESNRLTFEYEKCNYFGSDIYEDNSKEKNKEDDSKKKNGNYNLIEDPRILYDAFHAYWMLEFVKVISNEFKRSVGTDKKVAILLDNSPGFSSIENGVHDFLTDMGPEKGKVLLVSTIDPQDIRACRQSQECIWTLYRDKIAASKYYHFLLGKEKETDKKEKKVDRKESEASDSIWNSLCASGGTLPGYYSSVPKEDLTFVKILYNKVPQNVYKEIFEKKLLKEDDEYAIPFLNHLLYFFSNSMLYENDIIHSISFSNKINDFVLYKDWTNLHNLAHTDRNYSSFCDFISQNGYGDFFKTEWSPVSPFVELKDYLVKQEIIKDYPLIVDELKKCLTGGQKSNIEMEVGFVKEYVLSLIRREKVEKKLPIDDVATFVTNAIVESEGDAVLNLHTDSMKYYGIEEFVPLFGLAVYRLHVYDVFCDIINELAAACLKDIKRMEIINLSAISDEISDLLLGKKKGDKVKENITQMLSSNIIAEELHSKLKEVINSWGLQG